MIFVINSYYFFNRSKLDQLSEEQLTRFEFFIRSHFSRKYMKEMLTESLGIKGSKDYQITDEMAIIVSSLAKLFVGELVETGIVDLH